MQIIKAFLFSCLVVSVFSLPQESPERKERLDGIRKEGQKLVAEGVSAVNLKDLSLDEQKVKLARAQIKFVRDAIKKKEAFDESTRLRTSSMITCILRNIFEITKEQKLLCPPQGTPDVQNNRTVSDQIVLQVRDITTPLIENPPKSIKVARSLVFERNEKNFEENTRKADEILETCLKKLDEIVKILGLDDKRVTP